MNKNSDILIIDSTKGLSENVTSLHVRNSKILQAAFNCILIDSSGIDKSLCKKYKAIIFVHSSPYTNVRAFDDLMSLNKDTEIYYILNDYYLGEPPIVWFACKEHNIKYNVIANHAMETTAKVVLKYVKNWQVVNLNSLIYQDIKPSTSNILSELIDFNKEKYNIVYYGAYRPNRLKYFQKYFDYRMIVSTSKKNQEKFLPISNKCMYIDRLNWIDNKNTLFDFKSSLYIEDEYTNNNYSCFANRFYEALSYNLPCFFDSSCMNTIKLSNYPINNWYVVNTADELHDKLNSNKWENYNIEEIKKLAEQEKNDVINNIIKIING